jgi:DNA repair exonuclease SbcCD ATPase subunit
MANMDGEFINLFLQKQKEALSETMSRCLMVETRLSLSETKLQQLIETHKQICDEYERTRTSLTAEIQARKDIEQSFMELKGRADELENADGENKRLQKVINGLNVQIEILKTKADTSTSPNLK